ncbi:MAG: TlpA family protein disulfide reductase [Bacteroidales bacterium]|nr:TlpA family protein disulfide reductase [Bacteroidales bacterium]MCM1146887.1 TlpA family protein disulfide reductase [Bacteroidales bacterium]MCM1205615.1 TlpA family protein disulfide reductase [Bacillota bacterium]MCM1510274.1 TlpA family protein disulfide reductase [Clostridium sp.]
MKKLLLCALLCLSSAFTAAAQDRFVPTQEELAKYLPTLKAGDKAPGLSGKDTLGVVIDLARFKGSYVVVDFWATWCGDCRREIPALKALYEDVKGMNPNGYALRWLSFSFDFRAEAWKEMLRKESFPWPQISNLKRTREDPTFKNWQLNWIPAFFIIDPDGTVCGTAITADGLRKEIERLVTFE